ncbi:MAG: TonB-dependent receptor [Bacteroidetes bacterium]|nr:TonB-dependent receptor [Bacteroidota bacterium]
MSKNIILLLIFTLPVFAQELTFDASNLSSMSLEEILNITITTAGKKEEKVSEIPASVVVITREDIEKYGYINLEEIFKNIPGLFLIDDYTSQGPSLGVRGFWDGLFNRDIEIMINNVQQTYSYTNTKNFLTLSVPVESIERIEVVRGPMAIFYGSGAFFGAINIFTRDESGADESGIVSVTLGANSRKEGLLRYSGNMKEYDFNFTTDFSYFITDGPDVNYSKLRSTEYPAYWNANGDASVAQSNENGQFAFNLSGKYKNLDLNFRHTSYVDRGTFLFPVWDGGEGSRNSNRSTRIFASYRVPFSKKIYSDIKVGYYTENQETYFDFFDENFYGLQFDGCSAIDAEVNVFYNPSEKIKTTFGIYHHAIVDFYKTFDLPSFLDPSLENNTEYVDDSIISNYAFFTQLEYNILPNLKFVGGIRFEKLGSYNFGIKQTVVVESLVDGQEIRTPIHTNLRGSYQGSDLEAIPRAALLYSINENNVIKLLYGKAINQPSLFQNVKNINDPDNVLQAERLSTIEVNYSSNELENFYFSISAFRNELDNLITRIITVDEDGNNYSTFSANAGKMLTNGIELTVRGELNDRFGFEVSGTVQKTEDKLSGMENITPAYSPEWLGYFKAYFKPLTNLTLSTTANYVDRMETYWDNRPMNISNSLLDPIGRIGKGSSSYVDVGFNIRITDILSTGTYINLKCSNIFDADIHYPTYTNNTWADIGTFGYGRSFYITTGYKF